MPDQEYDGLTVAEAQKLEAEKAAAEREVVESDEEPTELEKVREELEIGEGIDPLSALLDAPIEPPTADVAISRLGVDFTVVAVTDDRAYDRLVERCTKVVKMRRGGRTREVDGRRLSRLTVAEYCTNPAFHPKHGAAEFEKLAEKFGTNEPEDLVDRALLMGEVDLLADKILSLSGFDDEVETAGN